MTTELCTTEIINPGDVTISNRLGFVIESAGKAKIADDLLADPEVVEEINTALRDLRQTMVDADTVLIEKWVASLGVLCAGRETLADVDRKIKAYSAMLEYPRFCFNKTTLNAAARKFKWVPSYQELTTFLDEIKNPTASKIFRLRKISEMAQEAKK